MIIFGSLLVGTILTVLMYYVDFSSMAMTVAVALFIASIKAFLVAAYFMHLMSEKKLVYSVLLLAAFFFTGLMGLTLWGSFDLPTNSLHKTTYVP
jgi:cytochrome c oxidase subunit 4